MCALRLASLVGVFQASFAQHETEEKAVRLLSSNYHASPLLISVER